MTSTAVVFANYNSSQPNNATLVQSMNPPFVCKNKKIALQSLQAYHSTPNISVKYNNTAFSYVFNGTVYVVNIPPGYYGDDDLQGLLELNMNQNGHYLVDNTDPLNPITKYFILIQPNSVYYSTTLTLTKIPTVLPANWTNPRGITLSGFAPQLIVYSSNNFGKLIGFNPGYIPLMVSNTTVQYNSSFTPQIDPSGGVVLVRCNLVNNGSNNSFTDVAHTFSINVDYGQPIDAHMTSLIWYPITDGQYNQLSVSLCDTSGAPLGQLDPIMTATFIIQENN